ncbi:MarR family winged helix-turn-helix transcriptional regulator [Microbulbifer sp.]|uniref:MarR family winged helix-turn-helix transcriptional regulator n=1 Tax=Microbulbifer sp. TaxID=1908541 RepID=UPI003F3D083A
MTTKRPPLSDPTDNLLGYHLRRLSVLIMADLSRSLDSLDLRPTEATVLMEIFTNPGITQSRIGKILSIKRANMAPLIAGLVEQGLVETARKDGRSLALTLSAKGKRVYKKVMSAIAEHEERCFALLGKRERRELTERIRELWQHLDTIEPG